MSKKFISFSPYFKMDKNVLYILSILRTFISNKYIEVLNHPLTVGRLLYAILDQFVQGSFVIS